MPKRSKFSQVPCRSGPSCNQTLSALAWAVSQVSRGATLPNSQAGWKTEPYEPFAPNQVWVNIWNYLLRLVHRVGHKPLLLGHRGRMIQIVKDQLLNGDRTLMAMAEKGVET